MVSDGWTDRKVTKSALNEQMKVEILKWLKHLLQLIDVTVDHAVTHLQHFLCGKGVVKDFQEQIKETVSWYKYIHTYRTVYIFCFVGW